MSHALYALLEERVGLGALEQRDEPELQYRWNTAFDAHARSLDEL